jgi:hypothetical protein
MPLGLHVMRRLEDDRVLVRSTRDRRIYADTVARVGRDCGLFVFGLPDNHAHAGVEGGREDAGRFAQKLGSSLKQRLGLEVPFAPAKILPIRDQSHLKNAFGYMLGQAAHHGVDARSLARGDRTVRELARGHAPAVHVRAVGLQLGLRAVIPSAPVSFDP